VRPVRPTNPGKRRLPGTRRDFGAGFTFAHLRVATRNTVNAQSPRRFHPRRAFCLRTVFSPWLLVIPLRLTLFREGPSYYRKGLKIPHLNTQYAVRNTPSPPLPSPSSPRNILPTELRILRRNAVFTLRAPCSTNHARSTPAPVCCGLDWRARRSQFRRLPPHHSPLQGTSIRISIPYKGLLHLHTVTRIRFHGSQQ
jgi:hypothetical protein